MITEKEKFATMKEMVNIFSKKFKVPSKYIARALFIDYVLSTTWSFEENSPPEELREELQENIEDCQLILDYILEL
jgi:hypothetical protein